MKNDGILRSTATVGLCTLLSRLLGFAREIFMAYLFGTTLWQSAFSVAFAIPNTFRRIFGEGALASAFVPVFTETMERKGEPAAWALAGKTLNLLMLALAALVTLGMAVIRIGAGVSEKGSQAHVVWSLLGIMFPYLFFICVAALCMAILNSRRRFLLPSLAPSLLNIIWILAMAAVVLWGTPDPGRRIRAIAVAVVGAGFLQAAFQFPALWRQGFRGSRSLGLKDANIRRVLILMGPAALGMGVSQVNIGVDRLLAFLAGPWAPAALSFAERLVYLPLGLFATAMSTVLLPTLSRSAAHERHSEMGKTVEFSLVQLMLIMAPAAFGLLVLADPIVTLAYQRGLFDEHSTLMTARALRFYAPGLIAFSLYKVFVPAFYALKDTRTPVKTGIMAVGVNLALNLFFVLTWAPEYRHGGLALGSVLASACNGITLACLLRRRLPCFRNYGVLLVLLRIVVCAALMAVVTGAAAHTASRMTAALGIGPAGVAAAALTAGILAGILSYTAAIRLCLPGQWREMKAIMRRSQAGQQPPYKS